MKIAHGIIIQITVQSGLSYPITETIPKFIPGATYIINAANGAYTTVLPMANIPNGSLTFQRDPADLSSNAVLITTPSGYFFNGGSATSISLGTAATLTFNLFNNIYIYSTPANPTLGSGEVVYTGTGGVLKTSANILSDGNNIAIGTSINTGSPLVVNRAYGTLPTGTSYLTQLNATGTANSGGSSLRLQRFYGEGDGSSNYIDLEGFNIQISNSMSGGTVGNHTGFDSTISFDGSGGNSNAAYNYRGGFFWTGATTATVMVNFDSRGPANFGSAPGLLVTSTRGFYSENMGFSQAQDSYGIYIEAQSGSTNTNESIHLSGSSNTYSDGIDWNFDTYLWRSASHTLTLSGNNSGATPGNFTLTGLLSTGSLTVSGNISYFGVLPVSQQNTTGTTTGYTANTSTNILYNESTFTGGIGSTAYRVSDVVRALKNYGFLAS